jgi:ABC-type nitrate/sulfonate/bicarbonate transport system substrate-binding protein
MPVVRYEAARIIKRFIPGLIALFIIGLTVFPGCANQESKPVHLKIGYTPYISNAPIILAQDEGYFAKQGLEVELIRITNFSLVVPLLSQNEIDAYGGSLTASFINGVAQNLKVRITAGKEYASPEGESSALLVRKNLFDSGVLDSVAKLKGRKVAVPGMGIISHFTLSTVLKTAGLTIKDVEVTQLTAADSLAAFQNGALDAATMGSPELQKAIALGAAVSLGSLNQLMPGFQYGFFAYGPNLLDKNPEAGKKLMVAYLQGVKQYNEGKTARNKEIIGKYLGMENAMLEKTFWTPIYPDSRIRINDVLIFQDWLQENGFVDKKVAADQLIDTRFIEYANKMLKP